jgi:flagellar motor protein MotB
MKKPSLKFLIPGVLAGLVLAYTGIGFLAVPAIVKSQAENLSAEKLHRPLTLGKVEFNPFTLSATVLDLKMMEPEGKTVFASFERLGVDLSWQSITKLAPVVQEIRLTRPYVHLVRRDENHYSIDDILALIAAQPPSPEPARFSLNNIQLEQGRIEFEDRPAGVTHKVVDLTLGLPFVSSLPADVTVFVEPLFSARINGAPLQLKGKARPFAEPKDYALDLTLDDVDVGGYLGYLPYKPAFRLSGARLNAALHLAFVQPKDKPATIVLDGRAALKSLALRDAEDEQVLKLGELAVQFGRVDLLGKQFEITRVGIDGLDLSMQRGRDGKLNLERMFAAPAAPARAPADRAVATTAPAIASTAPAAAPGAGVRIALKELVVRDAALRYAALRYADDPLQAGVRKLDLNVRDIAADLGKNTVAIGALASGAAEVDYRQGRRRTPVAAGTPAPASAPASAASTPMLVTVGQLDLNNWSARVEDDSHAEPVIFKLAPVSLSMQGYSTAAANSSTVDLQATVNKSGQLGIRGKLALSPFDTDLALDVKNFDLLPLQPYVTDYVNLRLRQAAISGKTQLKFTAGKGSLKGDASVSRLDTVDKASANDFLSWKSLALNGMDMQFSPFSLSVDRIALADFFARVIIDPTGRINVQDVTRKEGEEEKSLTEAGARARTAATAQAQRKAAPQAPQQAAQAAPPAEPLPPIRISKLDLSGGRVRFTDNFIKPNYTANLRELGGTVTGLSSDAATSANVNLRGNVNSAPLSIAGKINPLKRDLSLDLRADVRGMELAQLSAYSDKYVGYGIEKGKLTFEVAYQLENRQLKAENRLVLDQLTFGKESTNPDATKLPVNLAVALLSDRNGVIDINVPIGGSLDDPQFSLGGIILKIIGNAIMKTVTAPFALIGSLFGGSGEELSTLDFDSGRAVVLPAGEGKLKSLARALTERPGLKLDITGRYDPAEQEAMKHASLERKLRALKTKDLQARGGALPEGGVMVSKEERAALLARAYKDETFAKPRNVLGLTKTLPPEEIEKLILANTTIDEDDLLALGNRRAQAARDWLITNGQVPGERIFIIGAKPASKEDKGSASRAEFALH